MGVETNELIAVAEAALNGGRWDDALALLATALKEKESPHALPGIGQAHWLLVFGDAYPGILGIGQSSPEIAHRLFISHRTAAHHVRSLLTELDLRNRAQAAACAVRMAEKRYDNHDSKAQK